MNVSHAGSICHHGNLSSLFPSHEASSITSLHSRGAPGYMAQGFDPAAVPPDQLITARQTKSLPLVQSLLRNVQQSFMSLIRQCKMLIIMTNIYIHGFSIESIHNAASQSEGGLLIKMIQFLHSSPEIVTKLFGDDAQKFHDTLAYVCNSNKPMSRKEMIHCLNEANVPYDPNRLDEAIHLGTGSVGDVIEIILHNGERQVVKMISPSSELRILADLKVLRFLLSLIGFFKPEMLGKGIQQAANAFFDSVKDELNLVNEARKTQKQDFAFKALANSQDHYQITNDELPGCAALIPGPVRGIEVPGPLGEMFQIPVNFKAPEVSPDYLTSKVMCMQKIEGATLADNDSEKMRAILGQLFNVDPQLITNEILNVFKQLVKQASYAKWAHCFAQTGFFNADMHDGNLMVAVENGQLSIYFIDLGNAQQVSRETVKATFTLVGAMEGLMSTTDSRLRDGYADILIGNIQATGEYDPNEVDWNTLKVRIKDLVVGDGTASINSRMLDVFNLAFSCNVKVPKEMAALFRAKNLANSGQQALNGELLSNAVPSLLEILQHKLRQLAESPMYATLTQQQLRQHLGANMPTISALFSRAQLTEIIQQHLRQQFGTTEPVTGERLLAAIPEVLEVVQQRLMPQFEDFVPT